MRGEPGRLLRLDLLAGRVRVGLRESEEDVGDARQQRARALHRLNRVRERRRLRAVRHGLDLDELALHALLKRGPVVGVLNLVDGGAWNGSVLSSKNGFVPGG